MNRIERIISIIMLVIISLSNVATPAAYAAEVALPSIGVPGTDLYKGQFAQRPKFSVDSGSVLAASTSILTVGTQSLDLRNDTAASAHKRIPVKMQLLAKKVYRTDEDVALAVTNPDNEAFTTQVQDNKGQGVNVPITVSNNGNTSTVDLAPSDAIKPGKYKIIVSDPDGTSNEQDFTWGVLALNTDKTIYHPNEKADIAMAVLNDQGDMVCDAKVDLRITNKALGINDLLSTKTSSSSGQITISPQCDKHDFSLDPDYEAHYTFGSAGNYQFQLTAVTPNGTHTINDTIQVKDAIPFDVQRVSATRIYPPNTYPMTFNIKANRDFTGTVTETVPNSFTITPATDSAQTVASYTQMQTVYLNSSDPASQMGQVIEASSSGGLSMPFHGNFPITQGFGMQLTDPTLQAFYTHYGLAGHDGIDFGLPMKTPLYAVDDGDVLLAGPGDYGTEIVIQHSWGESYYGHLSTPVVGVSGHVTKGQLIGYSGMSGEATGPHLHFGMKPLHPDVTNGYYGKVDPMQFLPIGQGQSVTALGGSTNPIAQAVYNTTVLGASDSAVTPSPSPVASSPSTTPEVSPTPTSAAPTATPAPTTPSASQSATQAVVPSPTVTPTQTTTTVDSATKPDNTEISVLQKQIMLDEQIANSSLTDKVKIITWHVSLKKGESTSLGYDFKGPHVSPQFYLLGPAHFYDKSGKVVFQEQRQWQIASDDVGIEWYQNTTGSTFNGYSWQYRKKLIVDHTKVNGVTPVVVDSVNGGNNVTWSHTVSGTNPALLVGVAVSQTLDVNLSATATYNGTSMTQLALVHINGAQNGFLVVFGLLNPTTGTHTVEVDVTGGFAVVTGGSESFDNVTSFGTASTNSNTGTSPPVSTTAITTTSGNILAGFVANGSNITSVNAPGTSRFIANYTSGLFGGNSGGATTAATGGSDSITWSTVSDDWATVGVEVKGTSVTYDATGPSTSGYTPTAISSMSWNHTVSGTNPALLAELTVAPTGGVDTGITASATYNGTSMTLLKMAHVNNGTDGFIVVFGLTSAPTGTHTITVTLSGGTGQEVTDGSISFDNVGSFGTAVSNAALSGTQTTGNVTSTLGNIVAGFVGSGSAVNTVSSPATTEFTATIDGTTGAGNSAGAISPSTGSNVNISWPANTDEWAAVGVEVQAANTTGSLTNFPVEVSLSSDTDLSAKAQSSGADILFTDATGRTLLPYEIESYSSGTLIAWVQMSTLSSTQDTTFYMYYGNPSAASLASNTTWDSNYKGVWHLGNGTTLSVSDSTSNAVTTTNGTATATSGQIGGAANFSATHISTNLDANANNLEAKAGNTWSTETWFNTSTTGTIVILGRATNIGASTTFAVYLVNGALDVRLKGTLNNLGSSYNNGAWHSIAVTWDGTNASAYVDGVPKILTAGTAALQTGDSVCMGAVAAACTTSQYTGMIDEVRVSNSTRALSWVETAYNNENSPGPGGFISTLGSAETDLYAPQLSELLGHGDWFDSTGTRQPFTF